MLTRIFYWISRLANMINLISKIADNWSGAVVCCQATGAISNGGNFVDPLGSCAEPEVKNSFYCHKKCFHRKSVNTGTTENGCKRKNIKKRTKMETQFEFSFWFEFFHEFQSFQKNSNVVKTSTFSPRPVPLLVIGEVRPSVGSFLRLFCLTKLSKLSKASNEQAMNKLSKLAIPLSKEQPFSSKSIYKQ